MKHPEADVAVVLMGALVQVKRAVQMAGYKREKRGYTGLLLEPPEMVAQLPEPTDPFFQFQWYLVGTRAEDTTVSDCACALRHRKTWVRMGGRRSWI